MAIVQDSGWESVSARGGELWASERCGLLLHCDEESRLRATIELMAHEHTGAELLEDLEIVSLRDGRLDILGQAYKNVLADGLPLGLRARDQADIYLNAASLCVEDHLYSLVCAKRVLDVFPGDERALSIAEPILIQCGRLSELPDIYANAISHLDDTTCVTRFIRRALRILRAHEASMVRLGQLLCARGYASDALLSYREFLDEWRITEGMLKLLECMATQAEDAETLQTVLVRREQGAATPAARARMWNQLAEFFCDWQKDATGARNAWLMAAECFSLQPETCLDAARVYERMLAGRPGDADVAARLVELYARCGEWNRIAEAFAAFVRASSDIGKAADWVLSLEGQALQAHAIDEFVALIDDIVWQIHGDARRIYNLLKAKARVYRAALRSRDAECACEALSAAYVNPQELQRVAENRKTEPQQLCFPPHAL